MVSKAEEITGIDLKLLRIRKKRLQYEVAMQAGIHPARLSEVESGRRELSPELRDRLLEIIEGGE